MESPYDDATPVGSPDHILTNKKRLRICSYIADFLPLQGNDGRKTTLYNQYGQSGRLFVFPAGGFFFMAHVPDGSRFSSRRCKPCEGGVKPLENEEIQELLTGVPGWEYRDGAIVRVFVFMNYHQTMAFVNAVAWLAQMENHHPDMEVGYSRCLIRYRTHAIGGISENDFICAAKINAMLML